MDNTNEIHSLSTTLKHRVINVSNSRSGIHVTVSFGSDKPTTHHFLNEKEAKAWIDKNKVEVKEKFMQRIEEGPPAIQNPTNSKKNKNRKKNPTPKCNGLTTPSSATKKKLGKNPEPDIGLSIAAVTYNKVVTIKIRNKIFHDFDLAIEHVKTRESFQRERLNILIPKRDEWYREIWIPRVIKIIKDYNNNRIPFTELFFRMNDYYSKDFSEEQANSILSLCSSDITRTEETGEDGNRLAKSVYYSLKGSEPKVLPRKKKPVLPQPHISSTEDSSNLFKTEYHRLISADYNISRKDFYIGLDFGTSFTKAAYHYMPGDQGVFLFGDKPFKPSVVYYNESEKKLSFFDNSSGGRQIRFFKATMVKDSEQYSDLRYNDITFSSLTIKDNFEFLCSVFFIANILLFIRHKLNEKYPFDANLYVAMGIPIFGYNTKSIYNKALHAGIYIANKKQNPSVMSIEEVNELYLESMSDFDDSIYSGFPYRFQHCTIPELFTEALYLLNRNTFSEGYYYIIDIGGGTSDFAFISKENNSSDRQFEYFCPSAAVAKLGNEVRKACTQSKQAADDYRDEFGLKYRTTIANGKFGLNIRGYMEITQLLFGGGSIDPDNYYQNNFSTFTSGLRSISCKVKTSTNSIDDNPFIPKELNLSLDDKQRLIIATQLANPETSSSFLKAWPEQYDHSPPCSQNPLESQYDISDLFPPQYDDIN